MLYIGIAQAACENCMPNDLQAHEAAATETGSTVPIAMKLMVSYVLWILAPPLGLHHLYLGRDRQAILHGATFGGFGMSWLWDGVALPYYVRAGMSASLPTFPNYSMGRWVAMFLMAGLAGIALPSAVVAPPEVGYMFACQQPKESVECTAFLT